MTGGDDVHQYAGNQPAAGPSISDNVPERQSALPKQGFTAVARRLQAQQEHIEVFDSMSSQDLKDSILRSFPPELRAHGIALMERIAGSDRPGRRTQSQHDKPEFEGSGAKRTPNRLEPQDRQKFAKISHKEPFHITADESKAVSALNVLRAGADYMGARMPGSLPPRQAGHNKNAHNEAIHHLANLLSHHQRASERALPNLQASPFQSQVKTNTASGSQGLTFRTCLSEGSARKLIGDQQGGSAALRPPQGSQAQGIPAPSVPPGDSAAQNPKTNLVDLIGPGRTTSQNLQFNTVNSDVASDAVVDLNRVFGHTFSRHKLPSHPMFPSQASDRPLDPNNSSSPTDKKAGTRNLAGFGSLIAPGSDSDPARKDGNEPSDKPKRSVLPAARQMSGKSGDPPSSTQPASGPDPRILDWVLGNRSTILDKSTSAPASSTVAGTGGEYAVRSAAFPAASNRDRLSGPSLEPVSTLRRPVAIRANPPQVSETMPTLVDSNIEAIVAKFKSSSAPSSSGGAINLQSLPQVSQKVPELSMNGNDIGRVVQWAGQELALRDNKVKEAERLREEERVCHDAAMSAVAMEVTRIKAGQQALAKTHYSLQDMLSKKTAECDEKSAELEKSKALVTQLTTNMSEINQQCARFSEECHTLREEVKGLKQRLRGLGQEVPEGGSQEGVAVSPLEGVPQEGTTGSPKDAAPEGLKVEHGEEPQEQPVLTDVSGDTVSGEKGGAESGVKLPESS